MLYLNKRVFIRKLSFCLLFIYRVGHGLLPMQRRRLSSDTLARAPARFGHVGNKFPRIKINITTLHRTHKWTFTIDIVAYCRSVLGNERIKRFGLHLTAGRERVFKTKVTQKRFDILNTLSNIQHVSFSRAIFSCMNYFT